MSPRGLPSRSLAAFALLAAALVGGCEPDLDTNRQKVPRGGTFGQIVYGEACQRVAYLAELEARVADPNLTVDVTGQKYAPTCGPDDAPAPGDSPPKVVALQRERSIIAAAVDAILPKDFLDSMEKFLEAIVVLDDDGTMEATMRSVGGVLQQMIDDPAVTPALARMGTRGGYRPTSTAAGLGHAILSYPAIDDMLSSTLDLLLDDKGAPVAELSNLLTALAREMSAAKPYAPASGAADPSRTLNLALTLLATPSDSAGDGTPRLVVQRDLRGVARLAGGVAPPFVDDGTGQPKVNAQDRFVDDKGQVLAVPPPFQVPGASDPMGTTRDVATGRALDSGGQPIYGYQDLDGTVLDALVRESVTLFDPTQDNALGLLYGAGALLGARTPKSREYRTDQGALIGTLAYSGFALDQSPLLDLAHAYIQLLSAPQIRDALTAARTLLTVYEDPASRSVAAMLDVNDRGKKDNFAQIPATSDLYDDLIPIIVRVLRVDGLVWDLLDAMQDPRVASLGAMFSNQMLYADRFILNQDDVNGDLGPSVSGSWSTPVDHSQPDADWNRSVFQRMAHLIHDANNVMFCNKNGASVYGLVGNWSACDLFEVDDLALLFVLSMADDSVTQSPDAQANRYDSTYKPRNFCEMTKPSLIRSALEAGLPALDGGLGTGISGFTCAPTPPALARSLFQDPAHQTSFTTNVMDPVLCSEGDRFLDVHADSIFAYEMPIPNNPGTAANFYDAVRPLITAFAKHDECVQRDDQGNCTKVQNAAKIFVDMVAMLHTHWGSPNSQYFGHAYQSTDPGGARFSTGDGALTYEKLLADVFANSDIVPSMINMAPTLQQATLDGTGATPPALPTLLAVAQAVLDPEATPPGVAYRDGRTTTFESDGTTPVGRATIYYLLADAYAKKKMVLTGAPPDRQGAWNAATRTLVDEALTVENVNGAYRTKNRRMHGVTLALIDFLSGRYDAHVQKGDLDSWVQKDLLQSLSDSLDGPLFAALADLTALLETDPDTLSKLYGMLQSLVDPAGDPAVFQTTLTASADLVQLFLDDADLVPLARSLGATLDPDPAKGGALTTQLKLLKRAHDLDPNAPKAGDTSGRHATLVTVLQNTLQERPNHGPTPMSDLADAIAQVNRVHPDQQGDLDAADYAHLLAKVKSFLTDEERGFMKFVRIVQHRGPQP
jgi:hypothetical protein